MAGEQLIPGVAALVVLEYDALRKKTLLYTSDPTPRDIQQLNNPNATTSDNSPMQPQQLFVCHVCHFHAHDASGLPLSILLFAISVIHFHALDARGLHQHLSNSTHYSPLGIPFDFDADDNCNNSNSIALLDEDSSRATWLMDK
jgi:hypothetical protein